MSPVKLLKVSAPNRGFGFGVEEGRVSWVTQPERDGGVRHVDWSLAGVDRPITGVRIVFSHSRYRHTAGAAARPVHRPRQGRFASAAASRGGCPSSKGTFVVTPSLGERSTRCRAIRSISTACSDASSVTANSWRGRLSAGRTSSTRSTKTAGRRRSQPQDRPHFTVTFDEADRCEADAVPHRAGQLRPRQLAICGEV